MPIKVSDITKVLQEYAPQKLAYNWDNVGLLVGSFDNIITKTIVCLDVTPDVVAQAIKQKAQLIVSHHPVIFDGIKNLAQTNWHNKMLSQIIKNDLNVYCLHTNLDITTGGVNDVLAKKLNLQDVESLQLEYSEKLFKIAVFVPCDYADKVACAMTSAGAGMLGNYSHCTFKTQGEGSFMPVEGAKPFVGKTGKLQVVQEVKIEAIMTIDNKDKVIKAMLEAHPYEQVAYDVYSLENSVNKEGIGRIGKLQQELSLNDFLQVVKQALNQEFLVYADAGKKISTVAVCGGAGSSLIDRAFERGADVFITGDVKYHDMQKAVFSGLSIIDATHQATEVLVVDELYTLLKQKKISAVKAKEQKLFKII